MIKLPKIVRSRLARKTAETSAGHPDANLLAAFAEHSLLARERASVTAHLAECADCREYLALAFAAQEPELSQAALQPAGSAFGARSSGAWLKRWRWVASAAVACAVLAVALQYRMGPRGVVTSRDQAIAVLQKNREPQASRALSASDGSTPGASITSSVPPATKHARASVKREPQSIKTLDQRLPAANAAAVQAYTAARLEDSSPKPAPQPAGETSTLQARPAVAQPSAAAPQQNATAAQQNGTVGQQNAAADQQNAAFMPPRALAAASKNGLMDAEKLKAEARQTIVARRALAKVSEAPGVLWSINASPETAGNSYGVVQRSADRGKTWESVSLNERVNFRAVAAAGNDVWAGGSDGVLFHSTDGGLHWVEITVAGENSRLTGAIVRIDTRDPAQLRITTSSREEWISTDRGRHWTRE